MTAKGLLLCFLAGVIFMCVAHRAGAQVYVEASLIPSQNGTVLTATCSTQAKKTDGTAGSNTLALYAGFSATCDTSPGVELGPTQLAHISTVSVDQSNPYADDRVVVVPPSSALVLRESYNLRLKIAKGVLTQVSTRQSVRVSGPLGHELVEGSIQRLPVLHAQNGDTYITITPLALGEVEFTLVGSLSDGGLLHQRISVYVQPPGKVPTALFVNSNAISTDTYSLEAGKHLLLEAFAMYEGVQSPVKIDPHFVRFEVRATKNRRVISIDSGTGIVTPLAVGHAIVETSYGGLTTPRCVVVVDKEIQIDTDHSRCEELLAPSEKLPDMMQDRSPRRR